MNETGSQGGLTAEDADTLEREIGQTVTDDGGKALFTREVDPAGLVTLGWTITLKPTAGFVSAVELSPMKVQYTDTMGGVSVRSGGSRAWRNCNPGNIRIGSLATAAGSIGTAGGYSVFASDEAGFDAIIFFLHAPKYNTKTLASAITTWAPPADHNNTEAYIASVSKDTGIPSGQLLSACSFQQIHALARAIRKIEGWKVGTSS